MVSPPIAMMRSPSLPQAATAAATASTTAAATAALASPVPSGADAAAKSKSSKKKKEKDKDVPKKKTAKQLLGELRNKFGINIKGIVNPKVVIYPQKRACFKLWNKPSFADVTFLELEIFTYEHAI